MHNEHKSDTATLIEALKVLSYDIQSEDGVANAAIAEAAERLRELYEQTNWTSVKDKLPEYKVQLGGRRFVSVIAACGTFVSEALYEEGKWKILGTVDYEPSHWMYLPEPPNTEEDTL